MQMKLLDAHIKSVAVRQTLIRGVGNANAPAQAENPGAIVAGG